MHWRSDHKNACRQLLYSSETSVSILDNSKRNLPGKDKAASRTLWPEYEIGIEDECSFDSELFEDDSKSTSLVAIQNKTDEGFQSLSEKFEADNAKENWVSFQQRT